MENWKELSREYEIRFKGLENYRNKVWLVICRNFLQSYIDYRSSVLDIGSGYGEFIININASKKYAMDLNPQGEEILKKYGIVFVNQDCTKKWEFQDEQFDVIFSSNFLEHLKDKIQVEYIIEQSYRCLKKGGKIILLGPNIRYLADKYWDFWDHHIPISHKSVEELLKLKGFKVECNFPKFLPYSMSQGFTPPVFFVKMYLKMKLFWKIFGKQFLIIAYK